MSDYEQDEYSYGDESFDERDEQKYEEDERVPEKGLKGLISAFKRTEKDVYARPEQTMTTGFKDLARVGTGRETFADLETLANDLRLERIGQTPDKLFRLAIDNVLTQHTDILLSGNDKQTIEHTLGVFQTNQLPVPFQVEPICSRATSHTKRVHRMNLIYDLLASRNKKRAFWRKIILPFFRK